jgi:hypothetical protein
MAAEFLGPDSTAKTILRGGLLVYKRSCLRKDQQQSKVTHVVHLDNISRESRRTISYRYGNGQWSVASVVFHMLPES